jgi:hypothetical protein
VIKVVLRSYNYRVDNPTNNITNQSKTSLKEQTGSLSGDDYSGIPVWMSPKAIVQNKHIGNLDKMEEEVNNISSPSTPQILPSFEAHTARDLP